MQKPWFTCQSSAADSQGCAEWVWPARVGVANPSSPLMRLANQSDAIYIFKFISTILKKAQEKEPRHFFKEVFLEILLK